MLPESAGTVLLLLVSEIFDIVKANAFYWFGRRGRSNKGGRSAQGEQKDYWRQEERTAASRKARILELQHKARQWHTFPLRRPRHIFILVLSLDELSTTSIHTQSKYNLTTICFPQPVTPYYMKQEAKTSNQD